MKRTAQCGPETAIKPRNATTADCADVGVQALACAAGDQPWKILARKAKRRRLKPELQLLAFLLIACLPSRNAQAIEIKRTVWGFDGQVVMQRFNVFSVLVDNPAATAFDGTIELHKLVGGRPVDAVIVEPVYLAPFSSRWVQFYPYVRSDWDTWEVSWGKVATQRFTPPSVRSGKAAAVLLDDPDAIPASAGAIKRLDDNLFPAHSTATDCLAAVVLDHVPRWDPARQKSFLEWLKRGGRAYLLQSADGKFPEFAGDLQILNSTAAKFRLASGYVYRVERTRRQLDAPFVERVIVAGIEPGSDSSADLPPADAAKPPDPAATAVGTLSDYGFINLKWDPEMMLLTHLKKMSSPDHNWIVIHLLALIYLGLIFPGCFAIGQRHGGDFRITFGFLLGTIFVFSLAFLFVGRRGYNEATVLHSLAVARQEARGIYDVSQWSNAFAVKGGDYPFTHDGSGRIYSSCQDQELVQGEIRNGPDAHFLADIPPYSSRAFSHRGLIQAPPIDVEIEDWSTIQDQTPSKMTLRDVAKAAAPRNDRALSKLTLRKGSSFPKEYLELYALYARKLYRLKETGDRLELGADAGSLSTLLKIDQYNEYTSLFDPRLTYPGGNPFAPPIKPVHEPTETDIFQALFFPLLARSLEIVDQLEVEQFSLPGDRVRLLIYSPLTSNFFVKDPRFVNQHGYVLYSVDVFEPESR